MEPIIRSYVLSVVYDSATKLFTISNKFINYFDEEIQGFTDHFTVFIEPKVTFKRISKDYSEITIKLVVENKKAKRYKTSFI